MGPGLNQEVLVDHAEPDEALNDAVAIRDALELLAYADLLIAAQPMADLEVQSDASLLPSIARLLFLWLLRRSACSL